MCRTPLRELAYARRDMGVTAGLVRDLVVLVPELNAGELEARLAQELATARDRWPEARPDAELAAYALERARLQPDLAAALPRLRLDDLVLAWWCSRGDSRAISAFEVAHADPMRRLVQRFHRLDPDELRQLVRVKLFTGDRPRIVEYSGFGRLENWFRVIAARTLLDAARSKGRERTDALPDEAMLELPAGGSDPREAAARAEVVAAIKRALDTAIQALPPRERTFLRHVVVDGLTLDEIAAMHELHRGTVARTLAAARAQLHEATRELVLAELGSSVTSMLQLLDSQLDLSLHRLFPEPTL